MSLTIFVVAASFSDKHAQFFFLFVQEIHDSFAFMFALSQYT